MKILSPPRPPANGLLPVHSAGDSRGIPVVFLHGFLSDGRSWDDVAGRLLAASPQPLHVMAFDLPGHGAAADLRLPGDAWTALCDLATQTIQALHTEQPIIIGYSLGGRIAAQWLSRGALAARHLVVESAHPGIDDPAQRLARLDLDAQRAADLLRAGTAAFVAQWEKLPLFASQVLVDSRILKNQAELRNCQDAAGLAYSLVAFGAGSIEPLCARSLALPVTVMAGGADTDAVARLPQWRRACTTLTTHVFPDVGHNIHLENPKAWVRTVLDLIAI